VADAASIKAVIIDGQNNHQWQTTTPALRKILEDTGLFQVDVITTPPKGCDFTGFHPEFAKYQVVISNYNDFPTGTVWPADVQTAFEEYMKNGGGFVSYHAADNAFPNWTAYNLMIAWAAGWAETKNRDHSGITAMENWCRTPHQARPEITATGCRSR
jgi:uncharacterized protein